MGKSINYLKVGMSSSIPILAPPSINMKIPTLESPRVVEVLDRIRFEVEDKYSNGEMNDFPWFAREYPRAYRHHIECADFRIATISQLYVDLHRDLTARLDPNRLPLELSLSDIRVKRIYWDFESLLGEFGSALDLLTRIVSVAYKNEIPPNFNRFCRSQSSDDPYLMLFHSAQQRWVSRMKDYRDCFVHYTPADTMLSIRLVRRKHGYETRCKLPINPNERDITRFRFPMKVELMKYAISLRRNMRALDRDVASLIERSYGYGRYPVRTKGLFGVGRRERDSQTAHPHKRLATIA